jgi:hypothetical protein
MMTPSPHLLHCLPCQKGTLCFAEFAAKAFTMWQMMSRHQKVQTKHLIAIRPLSVFPRQSMTLGPCSNLQTMLPPWVQCSLTHDTFPTTPLLKIRSSLPASAQVPWLLSTIFVWSNGDAGPDILKPEMDSIVRRAVNPMHFHHLHQDQLLHSKKNG